MDNEDFGEVEHRLLTLPVKGQFPLNKTGTITKGVRGVILADGTKAIVKPATATTGGIQSVKFERAAWVFARLLGWTNLVAPTVVRTWTRGVLRGHTTSVQRAWTNADFEGQIVPGIFREDVWRAACFDMAVDHKDRRSNNFLLSSEEEGLRVRLIDHGFAFGNPSDWGAASSFVDMVSGQPIPPDLPLAREVLVALKAAKQSELTELLPPDEFHRFLERLRYFSQITLQIA